MNRPFDPADVYDLVHGDGANLVELWKRKSILQFVNKLEERTVDFRQTDSGKKAFASTKILGDTCADCKAIRSAALKLLAPMRVAIKLQFDSPTEKHRGFNTLYLDICLSQA